MTIKHRIILFKMKNYHNFVLKSLVIAFNISVAKVHSTVHFLATHEADSSL